MQEVFGAVTGFGVATLVTLLTQVVKTNFKLDGLPVLGVSLGLAFAWFVPFHLLQADAITPMVVYEAIFYSVMGWLVANGIYTIGKTTFSGQRSE